MKFDSIVLIQVASIVTSIDPTWQRPIEKAVKQLQVNPHISEYGEGLLIRSQSGNIYQVSESCQCKAFEHEVPCWHRAAVKLVRRYNQELNHQNPENAILVKKPRRPPLRIDGWDL